MKRIFKNHKGQSALEFIFLIVFLLAALLVSQKYIAQALYGRWKAAGDGLGSDRQYDPNSLNCKFDSEFGWFDAECAYDACDETCFDAAPGIARDCSCYASCANPACGQGF